MKGCEKQERKVAPRRCSTWIGWQIVAEFVLVLDSICQRFQGMSKHGFR